MCGDQLASEPRNDSLALNASALEHPNVALYIVPTQISLVRCLFKREYDIAGIPKSLACFENMS